MNILVEFEFTSGNNYIAKESITLSGNVYNPKITSISDLTEETDDINKSYVTSRAKIAIDDTAAGGVQFYRNLANSEIIVGISARIKDTSGNILKKYFLESFSLEQNIFNIVVSDRYGDIFNLYPEVITPDEFPNAVNEAYGKAKPIPFGIINSTDGTFKVWRVNKNTGAGERYFISRFAIDNINNGVFLEDGTDVSGLSSLVAGADGQSYVNYSDTVEDFLVVNATKNVSPALISTPWKQLELVLLEFGTSFGSSAIDATNQNIMTYRNYPENSHYSFAEIEKANVVLQDFSKSFEGDMFINKDRDIEIKFIDFSNLSASQNILESQISDFNVVYRNEHLENITRAYFKYVNRSNNFQDSIEIKNDLGKSDSITNYGEFIKEINYRYIKDPRYAYNTAKARQIMFDRPPAYATFIIDNSVVDSLVTGDLINITHSTAITNGARRYRILEFSPIPDTNRVLITAMDINHLLSLDTKTKLLLNSDTFDNSISIYNSAANGWMQFDNTGVVFHDTAQKKFGTSSLRANGSSTLESDFNTSAISLVDFDLGTLTNFSIPGFVRIDATGSAQWIFSKFEDANNEINLNIKATNELRFRIRTGGGTDILLESTTTLSAATWYFFLIAKVGSDWGLYINTTQEAHVSDAGSFSVDGNVFMFQRGDDTNYMTGHLDSFAVQVESNYFNAAPNAGLTDTVVIPVSPISWYNPTGI